MEQLWRIGSRPRQLKNVLLHRVETSCLICLKNTGLIRFSERGWSRSEYCRHKRPFVPETYRVVTALTSR